MKRFNDILPSTDINDVRDYYGTSQSRDLYKGTSFKMSGEWKVNTHYFNDERIIDFVVYKDNNNRRALISCTKCHISTENGTDVPKLIVENDRVIGIEENPYWIFVMSGTEGPDGKVWVPNVSEDGTISWQQRQDSPDYISSVNVKGPKGDVGPSPKMTLVKQNDGYYWQADGQLIIDPVTKQPVSAQGPVGKEGSPGKVYIPSLANNQMIFTLSSNATDKEIAIDINKFRGENGKTPHFVLGENGILYYFYDDDSTLISLGNIIGEKGDKGDRGEQGPKGDRGSKGEKGDVGPSSEFKIEFNKEIGRSVLYYRTSGDFDWIDLGPVGGIPGKNIKLFREKGDPKLRADDRILWGYDGTPVSEWTTLCYLEELRGDENIAYGCPSDFEDGEPSIEKIWYDPCDDAVGQFSMTDFLYKAYLDIGGNLPQEEFEKYFVNFNASSFEVKFAKSFEDLGEPTKEKLGKLWVVPGEKTTPNNLFDEWIVTTSPSTLETTYMWERFGGDTKIEIDLTNYTTRPEVMNIKNGLDRRIDDLTVVVNGKQEQLVKGEAITITEDNVIDVKIDPATHHGLSKSQNGIKLDLSDVKATTVKVGTNIHGGVEINSDQTIAEGIDEISDSIETIKSENITNIISSDNTVIVKETPNTRDLTVNISNLVSSDPTIKLNEDGKLSTFWAEYN